MVLLVTDHTRLSVPLDIFLLTSGYTSLLWKIVSDASPWRLAAGLYDYVSGRLLCWTTLLLPFSSADAHRFQIQREYLGHLTVDALDRRLQDLFRPSPWYNVLPMG